MKNMLQRLVAPVDDNRLAITRGPTAVMR